MARSIKLVDESPYPKQVFIPVLKKVTRDLRELFSIYNISEHIGVDERLEGCYAIINPDTASLDELRDNSLLIFENTCEPGEFDLKVGDILLIKSGNHVVLRKYKAPNRYECNFEAHSLESVCFIIGRLKRRITDY